MVIANDATEHHRYGTKSDHYIDDKYASYLPPVKPPREHRLG